MDCSFCGSTEEEVEVIVADTDKGVAICNNCVDLCNQVIADERSKLEG